MNQLILGSGSPRRRQILEQAGYVFRTSSVKVSEIPQENLNLYRQIEELGERKALALIHSDKLLKTKGNIVLGADTVVLLDGQILGKPQSKDEGREHLIRLSGKKHEVVTGFSLVDAVSERCISGHVVSDVYFKQLSEDEIQTYVESKEGFDKAGGYGIQGEARKFVERYEGSFLNIVGLPIERIEEVIEENAWKFPKK